MKTSTRNGPDDHDAKPISQPQAVAGQALAGTAQTAVRCRLCQETIVLESNFRATAVTCPHCGLKFVFDPQQEPLPVRGLRLRYAAVLEAQRRPGAVQHKRHHAHVQPALQVAQPRTNYLAWAGGLALSLAAAIALYGGWFHKLLAR
jgi:DNA-directed RNA polymerase subunit RPC12/RpoP